MDQPDQRSGGQGSAGGASTPSSGGRPPRSRPKKPPRRAAILGAVPPDRRDSTPDGATDPAPDLGVLDRDPAELDVAGDGGPAPEPTGLADEAEPELEQHAPLHDEDEDEDEPDDVGVGDVEAVDAPPSTAAYEPYPGTTPLDDLDADRDDLDDLDAFGDIGPSAPLLSGRGSRTATLVAGVLVVALAGYALGWSRGSAGLDQGSSPTTSIVGGAAPGEVATDPAATTAPGPAVDVVALPVITPTVVAFDDGLPGDLDGRAVEERGGWVAINGAVAPGEPEPLPDGTPDPRLMGTGPDVTFDAGTPVSLATVVLAAPTPLSGLVARYQDDGNYWAAVVDPVLTHVTLYEVKDGVQSSKAFVDAEVKAGTSIGIFFVDDQVGLVVDGQSRVLSTFFGPEPTIGSEGIAGSRIGLLTGGGTPAFDDLTFG